MLELKELRDIVQVTYVTETREALWFVQSCLLQKRGWLIINRVRRTQIKKFLFIKNTWKGKQTCWHGPFLSPTMLSVAWNMMWCLEVQLPFCDMKCYANSLKNNWRSPEFLIISSRCLIHFPLPGLFFGVLLSMLGKVIPHGTTHK